MPIVAGAAAVPRATTWLPSTREEALDGALIGLGIPEYEAKAYESFVNKGGALLSVHCDTKDLADRARKLLDAHGAKDISKVSEAAASKAS